MELTGLQDKVAVVTGAGRMRSIGRHIAVELARSGCDVVITGTGRPRDSFPADEIAVGWQDIDSVAEEIRALGRRCVPVVSNVSDEDDVKRLLRTALEDFSSVDILVNNAGAPVGDDRRPVTALATESWNRVIQTNLTGTFFMSREFGAAMVNAGRGGAIVNMSSIAGKLLPPFSAAYAASKAAVQALTACMAQEVGEANVRVNALCPGYVETSRLDVIDRDLLREKMFEDIPLRRAGQPLDIAAAVLFLCSDQGAWVTGQSWNVDGGHVVQH